MFPQHALDRIHRAAEHRNRTRRNTIGFELGARERRESAPVSPLAVEPYLVFDRVERRTDEGKQRRVRIAGGQVDDAIRNRLGRHQRVRERGRRHSGSAAAAAGDKPTGAQHSVRGGDGSGAHIERGRQVSDGGQRVPCAPFASVEMLLE